MIDATGYCEPHAKLQRKQSDEKRGTSSERGYGRRWQKARETYLNSHPLCECSDCERREQSGLTPLPASVVDHKIPHRLKEALDSGDTDAVARAQALFWDSDNWQAMSKPCHDRKTAREDGGFGRLARGANKFGEPH